MDKAIVIHPTGILNKLLIGYVNVMHIMGIMYIVTDTRLQIHREQLQGECPCWAKWDLF